MTTNLQPGKDRFSITKQQRKAYQDDGKEPAVLPKRRTNNVQVREPVGHRVRQHGAGRSGPGQDTRLGWEKHDLILLDVAVAVRYPDGSFTLNGERFPVVTNIVGYTTACLLAGLVLGAAVHRRGRHRLAGRVWRRHGRGWDQ